MKMPQGWLSAEGKIRDVFLAIRDAGGRGATSVDIRDATGHGCTQIGPILHLLASSGYVVSAGTRGHTAQPERVVPGHRPAIPWPLPIYLTPLAARALGPALDRKA